MLLIVHQIIVSKQAYAVSRASFLPRNVLIPNINKFSNMNTEADEFCLLNDLIPKKKFKDFNIKKNLFWIKEEKKTMEVDSNEKNYCENNDKIADYSNMQRKPFEEIQDKKVSSFILSTAFKTN